MAGADYPGVSWLPLAGADCLCWALIICVSPRLLMAGADYPRLSWLSVAGADYLCLALIICGWR